MGDDTLTHKDLAGMLGVSQTTIKNYRRKFPGLIQPVTAGKPLRFRNVTADICRVIRDGFEHGLSADEIRGKVLAEHGGKAASSDPVRKAGIEPLALLLESLSERIEEISKRQFEISKRLESIEGLAGQDAAQGLRDLLESILDRLDGLAGQGGEIGLADGKGRTVRIRSRDGSYRRYELKRVETEPGPETSTESETGQTEAAYGGPESVSSGSGNGDEYEGQCPPPEFFTLPMVVRSEQGEFLGVPGRTEGHLSIKDFLALLRRHIKTPGELPINWRNIGDGWIMHVQLGKPPYRQDHYMEMNRMTTPRGNRVAWLKNMSIGEQEVPNSFLVNFLKQLRKELAG